MIYAQSVEKMHMARVQLGRLKNKLDVNQDAVDAAAEKAKSLEAQRDGLYTGPKGIGRPKKARMERTEFVKCPFCLDDIYPYENVRTSFCHPVPIRFKHKENYALSIPFSNAMISSLGLGRSSSVLVLQSNSLIVYCVSPNAKNSRMERDKRTSHFALPFDNE